MEEKKLIVRSRCPEDERVVLVDMDEEGRKLLQDMKEELDQCCGRFLQEEPQENVEEIINGLNKLCSLAQNLKKEKK